MAKANEEYRQAWLRTHKGKEKEFKTQYPFGLNYFGENVAELMGLEKGEESGGRRKRNGECIAQQPPFHLGNEGTD